MMTLSKGVAAGDEQAICVGLNDVAVSRVENHCQKTVAGKPRWMPAKAFRIYVGARNTPRHTILPKDDDIILKTLSRYFTGWTIAVADGYYAGTKEESRIITVVVDASNFAAGAGKSPFESCVAQLKNDLKQLSIMVEAGRNVSFL